MCLVLHAPARRPRSQALSLLGGDVDLACRLHFTRTIYRSTTRCRQGGAHAHAVGAEPEAGGGACANAGVGGEWRLEAKPMPNAHAVGAEPEAGGGAHACAMGEEPEAGGRGHAHAVGAVPEARGGAHAHAVGAQPKAGGRAHACALGVEPKAGRVRARNGSDVGPHTGPHSKEIIFALLVLGHSVAPALALPHRCMC